MKSNRYIVDAPIELSEPTDLLKTGIYADALTKTILDSPEEEAFIIGLFGGWGAGKSSIVKSAECRVLQQKKKIKFITYDAWKYANDSFRRMFLLTVQKSLGLEQTKEMERFYKSESSTVEPPIILATRKASVWVYGLFVLVIFLVAVLIFNNGIAITKILAFVVITQALLLLFDMFLKYYECFDKVVKHMQINVNQEKIFAPEQFEDCFSEMMSKALKQGNHSSSFWGNIKNFVVCNNCNYEKIVIVVDNIDRCHRAMAYELLTDIKTFLAPINKNIIFVIPVDDIALQKYLFSNSNGNLDSSIKDKEEFLRKLFNVTLRIKPHQVTEMTRYTELLCSKYDLSFNNDTRALISKNFAKNPRRIVQLINNLITEFRLYDDTVAKKYESQIVAIQIIKEEFDDFYKEILNNPIHLLNLASEDFFNSVTIKKEPDLGSFLRIAKH